MKFNGKIKSMMFYGVSIDGKKWVASNHWMAKSRDVLLSADAKQANAQGIEWQQRHGSFSPLNNYAAQIKSQFAGMQTPGQPLTDTGYTTPAGEETIWATHFFLRDDGNAVPLQCKYAKAALSLKPDSITQAKENGPVVFSRNGEMVCVVMPIQKWYPFRPPSLTSHLAV